jgi:hypothetical protein
MLNPQADRAVRQYLAQFAAQDDFEQKIESIFGTKVGSAITPPAVAGLLLEEVGHKISFQLSNR